MTGDIKQFNFYRRYRWRSQDFADFQSYLLNFTRGVQEGVFSAAVVDGYGVSASGAGLAVEAGIALGPTGYLHVNEVAEFVEVPTAVSLPRRDLIVARPLLTDETLITKPTSPLEQVYLKQNLQSQIVRITGTEAASPTYPAIEDNDTVLAGVAVKVGASSFSAEDLDFEVKDMMGKNSQFQNFQAKYDDRCRPFYSSNTSLGIKPSQLSNPKAFTFISKGVQSKFPRSGGSFNNADTFLNFTTGVVTGGDLTSGNFTPTIPTAGNYIVASISLRTDDTLLISYGTQGTKAQCFNGIVNAVTVGAGSIALPTNVYRVSYVILGSLNGSSINSLQMYDARTAFSFGGPDNAKSYPNVFLSAAGNGDATTLADALALLPAGGGLIVVTDDITVPLAATFVDNTRIIGRSRGVTMNFTASSGMIMADNCTVEDLSLACTGTTKILIANGDCGIIRGNKFTAPSGNSSAVCIDVNGNGNYIGENKFIGVASPSLASGIVYEAGSAENNDANNVFTP